MLTIEHLNCGYGKHEILHDISVTIPDKNDYCHRRTIRLRKDNIFKNFKSYGGRGTRIYNRKDFSW